MSRFIRYLLYTLRSWLRVSDNVIKHHDLRQYGEEGFISAYMSRSQVYSEGKSVQELEAGSHRHLQAGTEAEDLEEHCSLSLSLIFVQPAFLYGPGPLARGGSACSGLPQSLIKMFCRLAYSTFCRSQCLSCGFFLPDMTRFVSTNKKPTSTKTKSRFLYI